MYVFESNGLRFYPINAINNPIGVRFDELPYHEQYIFKQTQIECKRQSVRFNDIIRIQVKSPNLVTWQIFNASNTLLSSGNFTDFGAFGTEKVWWVTINLATIPGLNNGSWIIISNGTSHYRTEPLQNEVHRLLKLTYSNYKDHARYGSYRRCNEMVAYIPASLIEHVIFENKSVFQDSVGRYKKLMHDWQRGRVLKTRWLPYWLINILHAAINHDVLFIQEKSGNYLVTSPYEVYNDELLKVEKPNEDYQGYEASISLVELNTYSRRLPAFEPLILGDSINILPETNITANSFTANWEAMDVDFYEFQLATNPNFTSPIINQSNILTNSFNVSGLSPCVKYYYRVRASLCGVFSAWTSNLTNQRQSLHFRGEQRKHVLNFDEKIFNLAVANIFGWANGIEYKITSGTITNPDAPVWLFLPVLTLTQLQSNINSQTGNYTILVSIQGYNFGSDALLELIYNTEFFWLRVGCTTYNMGNHISQDLFIGATRRIQIDSITLTNSATVVGYELITSPLGTAVLFTTSLSALNTAIASLLPNQSYIIGIYTSISNTTLTINSRYI